MATLLSIIHTSDNPCMKIKRKCVVNVSSGPINLICQITLCTRLEISAGMEPVDIQNCTFDLLREQWMDSDIKHERQ